MANRPSNVDITQATKPLIWQGSVEDVYMTEESAKRIPRSIVRVAGLQTGSGNNGDDSNPNDRPQLSDIESVTQTIYYDAKQKKKFAKVVIRIRNNSGQNLLGMDARITIPAASGGQQ